MAPCTVLKSPSPSRETIKLSRFGEGGSSLVLNFQANLPYAMVLGVEEAWAAKFEDILTTPPTWYSSSAGFVGVGYLSSSLNNMTTSLSRTMTSSPRSSGSGGGGGFGGGSSGGGGGGGGSSAG